MLHNIVEVMTAVGLATGLTRSAYVYIAVSASHVLGIALLLGPIILVDLWLLGARISLNEASLAALRTAAKAGVALAITSGVLLFSSTPAEYARNPVFWTKLSLVAVALANALAFEMMTRRKGLGALTLTSKRLFGATSLLAWLSVLLLGRAIAFA